MRCWQRQRGEGEDNNGKILPLGKGKDGREGSSQMWGESNGGHGREIDEVRSKIEEREGRDEEEIRRGID